MRRGRLTVCALALLMPWAACGGNSSTGDPTDAGEPFDGGGPVDLATATWVITPVDTRPESIALRPDLAISSTGDTVVVWPDIINIDNDTPLMSASSAAGFKSESRTAMTGDRASPSIRAAGERLHLVWYEDAGATNEDIFYARREAGGWTSPINLTGPADASSFVDLSPSPVEIDGVVTVFYNSRPDSAFENAGLFAVSFTDPANPAPAETIIDPAIFNCHELEVATDGESIHIIESCEENGAPNALYYVNNRSGNFVRQTVDLAGTGSPLSPDIAIGPDGSIHMVWVGSTDCPIGNCRDVLYSRDLAPPISVSNESEDGGTDPVVAVDALGRVVVVYHRFGSGDLLWTYLEPGGDFVRTQVATPDSAALDDSDAGGLEINPVTGRFEVAFLEASTGNVDVMHGELR